MKGAIPFEQFGDRGPVLHFAHANAYPPGAYRTLLAALAVHYKVLAVHHRPLWPGSRPEELHDWWTIAGDLIRFFDQRGLSQVVGVGHSLGAVTTMMASLRRPDLFRTLVLIEPVFLPPDVLALLAAGAVQDESYETPLVKVALKRRSHWPSREDAFSHFRAKRVFGRWPDETLWDYARYGVVDEALGGVRLAYSPQWEARIYALPPAGVWDLIPQVTHPTLAIRGRRSDTLTKRSWTLWQELQPGAHFEQIEEAGHLLPMEVPARVLSTVRAFVDQG